MTQMARTTQSSLLRKPAASRPPSVCTNPSTGCSHGYIRELFGQMAALDHNGGVMSVTIKEIEQAYSDLLRKSFAPRSCIPRLDAGRTAPVVKAEARSEPVASNIGASHALNSSAMMRRQMALLLTLLATMLRGLPWRLESEASQPPSSCPTMLRKTK